MNSNHQFKQQESVDGDQENGISEPLINSIPAATAHRLGLYLRELQQIQRTGIATVKSTDLVQRLGLSDSQIRRDLALFGQFGKRGVGYNVTGLVGALRKSLGTDGQWGTVLVGLGNLGSALVRYRGFAQQGFLIRAIYESDPQKIGKNIGGIPVLDFRQIDTTLPSLSVKLAIIAAPSDQAQNIAEKLTALGVQGILNFAPVVLQLDRNVSAVHVDLAIELQRLAFAVVNRERSR